MRASIHRAGYEALYTPVAPPDRRAVKSTIDVGVDRIGDIVGAAITQRLLWISAGSDDAAACAGDGMRRAGSARWQAARARLHADALESLFSAGPWNSTCRTSTSRPRARRSARPFEVADRAFDTRSRAPLADRLSGAPLAPAVGSAQGVPWIPKCSRSSRCARRTLKPFFESSDVIAACRRAWLPM